MKKSMEAETPQINLFLINNKSRDKTEQTYQSPMNYLSPHV